MNKLGILLFLFLSTAWLNQTFAGSNAYPLKKIEISQDEEALQRGAMIYYNVCRLCHSMKYIRFKTLQEIGFGKKHIDELRGDNPISTSLTKTTSERVLKNTYGQVPPDLSLMAKARKRGVDHIYTLLTTYSEEDNVYKNALMPGIKMPDALNIATAINEKDKTERMNQARDVTEFLTWASDPRAAERKTTGIFVILYFALLSILLYFITKRVWSRLDKED